MSTIALFHSVLGVRRGITDAAEKLRAAGHNVVVVDQYDGQTFNDYSTASEYAQNIGFPALMQKALDAAKDLPDGFITMGFSNGGGMATYVALHRKVSAVILCSGALPLHMIGADAWPKDVPAQLHATVDDPWKPDGHVESVMRSVNEAGMDATYYQYPGNGHLFTDDSLPDEYNAAATERFWNRVLRFCDKTSE